MKPNFDLEPRPSDCPFVHKREGIECCAAGRMKLCNKRCRDEWQKIIKQGNSINVQAKTPSKSVQTDI